MRELKQAWVLFLLVVMIAGFTACGSGKENSGTYDTLVIGTGAFDGAFCPFFYTSAYDDQVCSLIFESVVELDSDGKVVDNCGHVEWEEVTGEDGSKKYVYTISIREGMTFSDGEPVTIDDLIFTYYICADPAYDGVNTFSTMDIEGLAEYINSVAPLWKVIAQNGPENTDFTLYTEEQQIQFFNELEEAGAAFAREIVDFCAAKNLIADASDVAGAAEKWRFPGLEEDAGVMDFFHLMVETYNGDYISLSEQESVGSSLFELMESDWSENVELTDANEISGIRKVDDYTCTITFNSPNINAEKIVALRPIMPKHYYGEGFSKGDLSTVKAKSNAPLGSGAYIFESYDNNVVTLIANPNYWAGKPEIPTIKFQVVNEEDKLDLLLNGEIDITDPDPSASLEIMDQLEKNADKVAYSLVDNPGYCYIAINSERIPDINVRKGLMHLMNRAPAVLSHYGELGRVIERPMTPTLTEYPDDAKEYYGYDPAKALEYLHAAGYEEVDGRLMKDGRQLIIECGISDAGSHAATPILAQMANDMEAMGAQLVVKDMEFNNLNTEIAGGNLDMWVSAWGNATSCDLTQIFGSQGGSNYHRYYSEELDAIQNRILQTLDFDERCALVARELDMIMDAAVYMPIYQRKNMEIYNTTTLQLDTLPKKTTPYWNYINEIENLKMR